MKKREVVLTRRAENDLRHADLWIRQHNPAAADRFAKAAMKTILGLAEGAEQDARATDSTVEPAPRRALIGKNAKWRLYFEIVGDRVRVLHLRHGSQDDWTG